MGVLFLGSASYSQASSTAGLVDGLWFSEAVVTDFDAVTVYSVIHNQTEEQLKGIATLVVDGDAVGAQEVNVKKNDIQRIEISYHFSTGTHTVSMNFTAGNGIAVTSSELSTQTVHVVQDTDGDGVQNSLDSDDDNDGIEDREDNEPLVAQVIQKEQVPLTESGKALLDKVVSSIESKVMTATSTEKSDEPSESGAIQGVIKNTITTMEDVRKSTADTVRTYQKEQAAALTQLTTSQDALAAAEGFEATPEQQAKKHELQIASAGASVASVMLEQAWLFYMEIVVLILSTTHLLWVWFKRRFANLGVEEEE